jgi:hypothetical protein
MLAEPDTAVFCTDRALIDDPKIAVANHGLSSASDHVAAMSPEIRHNRPKLSAYNREVKDGLNDTLKALAAKLSLLDIEL